MYLGTLSIIANQENFSVPASDEDMWEVLDLLNDVIMGNKVKFYQIHDEDMDAAKALIDDKLKELRLHKLVNEKRGLISFLEGVKKLLDSHDDEKDDFKLEIL